MAAPNPPLPPVNVVIPPGPAQAEAPIYVDANDEVVALLQLLNWQPAPAVGGIPRVSLTHSEAMVAFAVKLQLDKSPAVVAALAAAGPLTFKFTAGMWSKLLTEVRESGLRNRTIAILEHLHEYIADCVQVFVVAAVDCALSPPLAVGGNAAARAASAAIRFLGMARVEALEITDGTLANSMPFYVIAKLAGVLGGVHTQAARLVETSDVQAAAGHLRAGAPAGANDSALARGLRSNILLGRMPKVLRAHRATADAQLDELADSFTYKQSDADRKAVEQKRLHLMHPWYAARPHRASPARLAPLEPRSPSRQEPRSRHSRRQSILVALIPLGPGNGAPRGGSR